MMLVLAPSTFFRKRGTRVKIISLLTSVSRLTIPRKKTLGLMPKIFLGPLGAAGLFISVPLHAGQL
jgi:hypothetical protein